jgi:hypothetical protein
MNLTETSVTTTTNTTTTTTEDDRRSAVASTTVATSTGIGTRPWILGQKVRHSARIVGHHHFCGRAYTTNPRVVVSFFFLFDYFLVWGFLFLNSGLGGKISGVFFGYLGRE